MKKTLGILIATLMSFSLNAAPVVQWGVETDVTSIGYDGYYDTYALGVGVSGGGGVIRSIDIDYIDYDDPVRAVLTPGYKIATMGSDIILVTTGYESIIDYNLLFNATGNIFLSDWGGGANELTIEWGESVLLAFVLYGFNVDYNEYVYDYGWFELTYGFNAKTGEMEVYVSDSAADTMGRYMIAGTYSVVPEPATALLALSGIALLLHRHRKRKPLCEKSVQSA